jgi:Polyketide cyclase / dehydrase and lipid transport
VIRVQLEVDRPVSDTFDYFADFRNENEWNTVAHDIRMLTDAPVGTGSRFRGEYDRMGTMEYEIIEFVRPRHLRVHGTSKTFRWVSTFDFTSTGDGTRIDGATDMKPGGLLRLLVPLMQGIIKRQMIKGMGGLKQQLEAGRPVDRVAEG